MGETAASVGYLILFACIFGCIFLGLLRWNREEKTPLDEQQESA